MNKLTHISNISNTHCTISEPNREFQVLLENYVNDQTQRFKRMYEIMGQLDNANPQDRKELFSVLHLLQKQSEDDLREFNQKKSRLR